MAKIVFLSDMHLSLVREMAWPEEAQRTRLRRFLDQLVSGTGNARGVDTVVLLGDVFDTWRCPPDREPPGYDEIIAAHRGLIEVLGALAAAGKLVYVLGNHDFDVPSGLLTGHFAGAQIIGPGNGPFDHFSVPGSGLYAQHGHQYSIFNRVSTKAELLDGYPIGYYITRLRAGWTDGGGTFSFGQLHDYLQQLKPALHRRSNPFTAVIAALSGTAREVRFPGRRAVPVAAIRAFAVRLGKRHPVLETAVKAAAESTLLAGANHACALRRARRVVFGHTHRALLDAPEKFPPWNRRTYVNTGCWCAGQAHFGLADTDAGTMALHAFQDDGVWVPQNPVPGRS